MQTRSEAPRFAIERSMLARGDTAEAALRLAQVPPRGRDADWEHLALRACARSRTEGLFEAASTLAACGRTGPFAAERAWIALGLGRELPADAPEDVRRAARLLGGRRAGGPHAWRKADPRARVVDLAWDLMDGDTEAAAARVPGRLPAVRLDRQAWRGLVSLATGRLDEAAADLEDARGAAGAWARNHLGRPDRTGKARDYAGALRAGEWGGAARLVGPETVADADLRAARLAAAAHLAPTDRGAAARHLDALPDAFDRALYKARLGLTPPAPGWMEVARLAAGPRSAAKPLALLRAAVALAADGRIADARASLERAGEGARRFPEERAAAEAACAATDPVDRAILVARSRPNDGAAWLTATRLAADRGGPRAALEVAAEAWRHEIPEPTTLAVARCEQRGSPGFQGLAAALAGLDLALPFEAWCSLAVLMYHAGREAFLDIVAAADRHLGVKERAALHYLLALEHDLLRPTGTPPYEWLAGGAWLDDPVVLATALAACPERAVDRAGRAIHELPAGRRRDELVAALVEGALAAGCARALARYVPSALATPPGELGAYVLARLAPRRPGRRGGVAPRPPGDRFRLPKGELDDFAQSAADFCEGVAFTLDTLAAIEAGAFSADARSPSPRKDDRRKKKAKRKAEKAARRKNR